MIYLLLNEGYLPTVDQLQAAIVACHAEATDWLVPTGNRKIVVLYDMLLHVAPSPLTRLHRFVAVQYTAGPQAALAEVDTLADALDHYYLYHATRAELLRALGPRVELGRPTDVRSNARQTPLSKPFCGA